jgi:hypothetical protein
MTRLVPLVFCAALGLSACGSSINDSSTDTTTSTTTDTSTSTTTSTTKDPLEVVPVDNEISDWLVDKAAAKDPNERAMTATTLAGVINLVDGGAEPFFMDPYKPKMFLWQNYTNKTLAVAGPDGAYVKLYILYMPSAEQASGLYSALLTTSEYGRKAGTPDDWQPTEPTLGTESRIQDTGTQWWVNFHKDEFYIDFILDPSFGTDFEPHNPDLKQAAVRFGQELAKRI